ncbi:hypothetical protein O3297_10995 [Janthinobacterium sp. SUN128]|uniref:hypothetical protein n=1 Tax=Janthinobacterium sp. SUN128 TaxID=3014790 RepID=UPI0027134AE3|nr:hypothetical protein [Janthinobacterium sp. SUN128]MDO8033945.1 hypothetical protein [Janthinobacterium sp. SUN128]
MKNLRQPAAAGFFDAILAVTVGKSASAVSAPFLFGKYLPRRASAALPGRLPVFCQRQYWHSQ